MASTKSAPETNWESLSGVALCPMAANAAQVGIFPAIFQQLKAALPYNQHAAHLKSLRTAHQQARGACFFGGQVLRASVLVLRADQKMDG